MLALTPTLGLSLALSLSRSTTQHLQQHGYAVVPNFVAPQTVEALKRDVSQLHAEGRFATAGVGESGTNRVETTVRKCQQCFIFPQFKYKSGGDEAARATLYGALESLRDDLQTHCGVPLDGLLTEGLYATYPNGGFYRRHVDAVEGTASRQRQWSYLLYLNTDWKEADGGCLRIHTDGGGELAPPGAAPSYVDVEPRAGTCAASAPRAARLARHLMIPLAGPMPGRAYAQAGDLPLDDAARGAGHRCAAAGGGWLAQPARRGQRYAAQADRRPCRGAAGGQRRQVRARGAPGRRRQVGGRGGVAAA